MDALDAIFTRRSIRVYTNEPVADEHINTILKAGMHAPSAGNQQPWHFIVIRDRNVMRAVPDFHPHALMLPQADVAILVCGDPTLELHPGYWPVDCAAATENMLLASHALGLGAVWLGIYPREERIKGMRRLCMVPETVMPFALLSIGHPAETKTSARRFNETKIHYDQW